MIQIEVNFRAHPSFRQSGHKDLELRLFKEFIDAGVLVAPGECFQRFQFSTFSVMGIMF